MKILEEFPEFKTTVLARKALYDEMQRIKNDDPQREQAKLNQLFKDFRDEGIPLSDDQLFFIEEKSGKGRAGERTIKNVIQTVHFYLQLVNGEKGNSISREEGAK